MGKVIDRRLILAGTLLIKQGTMGNCAYIIENGRAEIYLTSKNGKETKLAEVGPGSIVGEMAILTQSPRNANVRLLVDSTVITVTAGNIKAAMISPNPLQKRLMQIVMARIEDTQKTLLSLKIDDVEKHIEDKIDHALKHIPENNQAAFKKDILPLLAELKAELSE